MFARNRVEPFPEVTTITAVQVDANGKATILTSKAANVTATSVPITLGITPR